MKIKNLDLKWNALLFDFNKKKVVDYNVLWSSLPEEIASEIRKEIITDRDSLKDRLSRKFMAQYWSRAEYEIIVSDLHMRSKEEKIDVYRQIAPNIDRITDYIIKEMRLDF